MSTKIEKIQALPEDRVTVSITGVSSMYTGTLYDCTVYYEDGHVVVDCVSGDLTVGLDCVALWSDKHGHTRVEVAI